MTRSTSFDSARAFRSYLYHDETEGKENVTEDLYRNQIAVTILNSIAVVPTVFSNALVIFAVSTRRPLQSNANILLACLAVTDLLCGMILQPIEVALNLAEILGVGPFWALENIFITTLTGVVLASIDHLVMISVERYIAIKYSSRYSDINTRKWLKTGVLLAWAFAVLVMTQETIIAVADTRTEFFSSHLRALNVVYLIIGIFYLAAVSYANVYMCLETKRHKKSIQNEQVTYEEARKAKKDRRLTTTAAMVLAALVFTTCPSQMFLWKAISDSAMEPNARTILWKWTITSLLFRSLHNPIIYCWRVRKMRRAFLEVLNLQT